MANMSTTGNVLLRHVRLIERAERVRSNRDRRYMVARELHEYRDTAGAEYRKSFEVWPGRTPSVPRVASNEELNALKYQW